MSINYLNFSAGKRASRNQWSKNFFSKILKVRHFKLKPPIILINMHLVTTLCNQTSRK